MDEHNWSSTCPRRTVTSMSWQLSVEIGVECDKLVVEVFVAQLNQVLTLASPSQRIT
jgi:hypothetical protein